ncbi:outer membrane beta-barrel protein [Taibaiella koreensis]|uniref:outer membrane beta-barrel protein n=1 Tax=Taibaiella koreensis TaxID=1268548 RepID=UPI000E59E20A|nr:outer membrane beta-barrel protein [Taibaiella koreensis]
MKKVILSALLIGGAAMAANAQANSVLVFGDLGINTRKDAGDNKTLGLNIHPGVGYQFDDHWTLGVTGSFGTTRRKASGAKDWTYNNEYTAGVFGRYTQPLNKIFAFYAQAEALYLGNSDGSTASGVKALHSNGFRATVTPAIAIMVHKGFALNFSFGGAEFETLKASGAKNAATGFNLTFGSQAHIGVSKNIFCGHGHRKGHHMKMNHGSRMEKEEIEQDKKEDNSED